MYFGRHSSVTSGHYIWAAGSFRSPVELLPTVPLVGVTFGSAGVSIRTVQPTNCATASLHIWLRWKSVEPFFHLKLAGKHAQYTQTFADSTPQTVGVVP
jgi:hypothetical protein